MLTIGPILTQLYLQHAHSISFI